MDVEDQQEPYRKYIEPYRVYLLIFEFIIMPAGAILAGYLLGKLGQVSTIVIGYIVADILVTVAKGRTLFGIKIARIKPWKVPHARVLVPIFKALFLIALTAIAILEVVSGQLLIGLGTLCLVALCICFLILRRMKQYERPLAFISSLLLLAMVLLIAASVENTALRLIILLLALAWGFFVALGAYNLVFRREKAHD
jgi:predicted neutral ceramidase superfamily lipid hydrolase